MSSKCFSDDLWDKFDVVVKKIRNGKNFTGTVTKFLQKRAQIESTYAKSLSKLCKDKAFTGEFELGSLKDTWQVIKDELDNMATKHDALADETNTLCDTVTNYLTEGKKFRKTLVANGDKVTKELRAAETKESKAKLNYEQLKKKQEESEEEASKVSGTAKESKAKKNAEAATKKAELADNEYKDAVKQLQASQQKFYHDEMPKVLDDLQKFEEERIDKMKEWFMSVVRMQEAIPPAISAACQNMRKSVEAIDRAADIASFITSNTSGAAKPPEAKYEPYVPSNDTSVARHSSRLTVGMVNSPSPSRTEPTKLNSSSSLLGGPGAAAITNNNNSGNPFGNGNPSPRASVATTPGASPAAGGTRQNVRALYNYDATEDNELSFKANDKIVVLQKDDSGWWQGELNGKVGMFPSNFVESLDGGGGGAKDSPQNSDGKAHAGKYKVLYDYNADSDSELSIKEGEILVVETEDEGWYFGHNSKGASGRFPSNYVQQV